MNNALYAIRNILKNRVNSTITVVGLSVAFACLLLIFIYVNQEFSFNEFHTKKQQIYRINYSAEKVDGSVSTSTYINPEFSKVLKENVPQVKFATAYRSAKKQTMTFSNQNLEEVLSFAEPDFFDMFSFKLLYCNQNQLLTSPNEVVLAKALAQKLAHIKTCTIQELLGQSITFMGTGDMPFIITGILDDIPKNSSLQFSALIPFKYENKFSRSNNMFGNSLIYYEMDESTNFNETSLEVGKALKTYYADLIKRMKGYKVFADSDDCFKSFMISINDTHLHEVRSDYEANNSKSSLYILSVIGLLILIIACINFILLSLGQAFKKAGEVGIRNTLGARKMNIFNIFFSENLILSVVAVFVGAFLCRALLPIFNSLAPNEIFLSLINIPNVAVFIATCLLLIAFSTSIIPALKLINIQVNLLSSKKLNAGNKGNATQLFVTFQYALSILLIILTISLVRQTNYMKYKDLGFSSENIIDLRIYHLTASEKLALRNRLKNNPNIINLTLTDRNYASGRSSDGVKNKKGENIQTRILGVDNSYIPTLKLQLIQGENFTDSDNGKETVIINEELLARLDLQDSPIGNTLRLNGNSIQIVGVIKDHHYDSMQDAIEPLILRARMNKGDRGNFILLRHHPNQLATLIPFIKNTWNEIIPDKEIDLKFWDEQLNNRYQAEEKWSRIIGYASAIAIIISSLGLFGLTLMVVNVRKKEIGIRKINGAKITEVMTMLNKDFVKWVLVAFVISTPVAWYVSNKWLENFAYKTTLSWWIFALAGVLALGVALLTVSWQSWKAATRNPVEALRYE